MGGKLAIIVLFLILNTISAKDLSLESFQNKWSGSFSKVKSSRDGEVFRAHIQGSDFPSYIEKVFSPVISFREKFLKVVFKVSDLSKLSGMELRLSSEESGYENFYAIPIPLFTDKDFNTIQTDAWVTYTFTMGEARVHGEPDLDNIVRLGFYLGGNVVDIDFKEISVKEAFPQSIVTFTFDDGYDDHYLAAEIMSKYELAGTAYLMPRQINEKNYLTENQVRDLKEKYQWDLSSHHKIPILDFTYEELSKEMDFTKKYLENFDAHKEARHFAYPLGKQSRHLTLPLIRRKFDTARIAGGGAETLPPADWHMLRTFNVMPHISPKELLERVKKAEENGEWLILMFHYITEEENPTDPLAYNKDKFEEFCQLVDENSSLVLTINDVFQAFEQ